MVTIRKGAGMSLLMAPLAALLLMSSPVGAEERYWAVAPGEGIGEARLGMALPQVEAALAGIPCPDWAFTAEFEGGRLTTLTTACGGAVRLESGVQVGSALHKVVRQFGQPDRALIVEDGRYDDAVAYWIPYPSAGIAFRVVVYRGDAAVQSIRVMFPIAPAETFRRGG